MQYIEIKQYFTAIFSIQDSQSTDTVTYQIFKASTKEIFAQGNCEYVAGINWKVIFRPKVEDVFIVEVNNQTLDVVCSQSFQVVDSATLKQILSN